MAITKDMSILEVVQKYPDTVDVFVNAGMGCLGCAAVFAVDVEIDPAAALAVQDSRDACDLKLDFFHNGSLLFWGALRPVFLYDSTSSSQTQTVKSCYHPYCKTILNGLRYALAIFSGKIIFI